MLIRISQSLICKRGTNALLYNCRFAANDIRAQEQDMDVDPGEYKYEDHKTPIRKRIVDDQGRSYGTGKRKTAIARVWVKEGNGQFIVNDMSVSQYFVPYLRVEILKAFLVSETAGLLDVYCTVQGGGISPLQLHYLFNR